MHYLQLFFQNRDKPILVPVSEKNGLGVMNHLRDRTERLGFLEVGSSLEQDIWFNADRLQMAQLLLEMDQLPFDPQKISSSKQFSEQDEEPDLFEVRWQVTFWIRGKRRPLIVNDLSGHDWAEIYTSCDCGEQFIVVTDEDGEEVALRVLHIDMLSGLELGRYTDDQLEAIRAFLKYEGS